MPRIYSVEIAVTVGVRAESEAEAVEKAEEYMSEALTSPPDGSPYDADYRIGRVEAEDGEDTCSLCVRTGVHAERTTYCNELIGVECGCQKSHEDCYCDDPGCAPCLLGRQVEAAAKEKK